MALSLYVVWGFTVKAPSYFHQKYYLDIELPNQMTIG